MKKRIVFAAVLVSFSLFLPSLAKAQESFPVELTITPPTAYLKVKPGSEATHTITITNNGTKAMILQPELVDFRSDGLTGKPILAATTTFPYLDADSSSFQPLTVTPNAKAKLTLHFSVPQGVPNKEYPLTLLFRSVSSENQTTFGNTAQINASIGSNLIVLVSDKDTPDASFSLESFHISKIKDSFRPITFNPVVENTGFSATVASGSAEIKNWQGKVVSTFPIYPVVILGNSSRELQVQIDKGKNSDPQFVPGNFYYKQPFFLGVYTVSLTLTSISDPQKVILTASENIIELPIILILCVVIGLSMYSIYKWRQRRNNPIF